MPLNPTTPYQDRNRSPSAKRKIAGWAKRTGLPTQLVHVIVSLSRDYDASVSWVADKCMPQIADDDLYQLCRYANFAPLERLDKAQAVRGVETKLASLEPKRLFADFCVGVRTKNTLLVSPFSTYCYLRNASERRLQSLPWNGPLDLHRYAKHLFLKLFRAGCMEKCQLGYAYTDFRSYSSHGSADNALDWTWLSQLLSAVDTAPAPRSLSELRKACKGIVPGDAIFKTLVLEALSYAGILSVDHFDYANGFLADERATLSNHYYSNEWQYPLRVWSEGGRVNYAALASMIES